MGVRLGRAGLAWSFWMVAVVFSAARLRSDRESVCLPFSELASMSASRSFPQRMPLIMPCMLAPLLVPTSSLLQELLVEAGVGADSEFPEFVAAHAGDARYNSLATGADRREAFAAYTSRLRVAAEVGARKEAAAAEAGLRVAARAAARAAEEELRRGRAAAREAAKVAEGLAGGVVAEVAYRQLMQEHKTLIEGGAGYPQLKLMMWTDARWVQGKGCRVHYAIGLFAFSGAAINMGLQIAAACRRNSSAAAAAVQCGASTSIRIHAMPGIPPVLALAGLTLCPRIAASSCMTSSTACWRRQAC